MKRTIFIGLLLLIFVSCKTTTIQETQQNTVSVSGIGMVQATPDMVLLRVSFSHTAPTTKEAKKVLNQTMQQIVEIVKAEGVDEKYIKTTSLNYSEANDWRNGRPVRIGQRASQSLAIQITDIINNPERFSAVIDKVTAIEKVGINNITFDIENKTELFRQSRELAFQKAQEKAEQYAKLSGQKLGKALTITETSNSDVAQIHSSGNIVRANYMYESDNATDFKFELPSGEQGVALEVNVTFLLE
ncbi:MAG: SIMPL domain-containing protein [Bacteroidetes bacterium]|nr:SIMPL domain-containing protein [Bacteroidota bacterium]